LNKRIYPRRSCAELEELDREELEELELLELERDEELELLELDALEELDELELEVEEPELVEDWDELEDVEPFEPSGEVVLPSQPTSDPIPARAAPPLRIRRNSRRSSRAARSSAVERFFLGSLLGSFMNESSFVRPPRIRRLLVPGACSAMRHRESTSRSGE
jgi:hypothetical protein